MGPQTTTVVTAPAIATSKVTLPKTGAVTTTTPTS